MQHIEVTSSNIKSIGYDAVAQELEVLFKNGGLFVYHDVPPEQYERLMGADNVGKYFHSNIKNQYKTEKL